MRLGPLAADVVFYLVAIIGYELGRTLSPAQATLADAPTIDLGGSTPA